MITVDGVIGGNFKVPFNDKVTFGCMLKCFADYIGFEISGFLIKGKDAVTDFDEFNGLLRSIGHRDRDTR